MFTSLRITLGGVAVAATALIGLTACGPAATGASMSPEATALTALGFSNQDLTPVDDPTATPSADPSAAPEHRRARRLALRRSLRGNVQHGEVVVATKNGEKTIDVQRGTVTAIDATSITVRCTDGFTLTWAIGNPVHVLEHRTSVQPSAVKAGATVGIAGTRSGSTVTAVLIVIPAAK